MKNRKLLGQLLKITENVFIERILFFYKSDLIARGLEGNSGLLDEFSAGVFLTTFSDLEAKYRAGDKVEQAKMVSGMFTRLDNWRNHSNHVELFSYIWLLQKIDMIPTDNFNGMVVIAIKGNLTYAFDGCVA